MGVEICGRVLFSVVTERAVGEVGDGGLGVGEPAVGELGAGELAVGEQSASHFS